MTREKKINAMNIICDKSGCNEEQRKRHIKLYVDEEWCVHAPSRFKAWWKKHPARITSLETSLEGITAVTAYNTKLFRQEYLEAKQFGAV